MLKKDVFAGGLVVTIVETSWVGSEVAKSQVGLMSRATCAAWAFGHNRHRVDQLADRGMSLGHVTALW